jgi:hypothetical protein
LDIFIRKACYTVLGRCIHPWMGLLTGESDCLGFHVQCVDESAYSVQNTIIIYRNQLIFRICSTCSIYSTPMIITVSVGVRLMNLGCLIMWCFTGELTEIYTVRSHLEKVVPRSGSCKLNMMTRFTYYHTPTNALIISLFKIGLNH